MNEDEHLAEVRRWLKYAQEDFQTAQQLLDQENFVPRQVCWFAQQLTEKALKAVLIFVQIEYPFTHDLDRLCSLIPDEWGIKGKHPDLASLTEWSVESRYPGNWPEATPTEAKAALQEAQSVWQTVSAEFRRRDIQIGE